MKPLTDHQLESAIANMLRCGVTLAAAVVFAGGILALLNPALNAPDYSHFKTDSFPALSGILHGVLHLNPADIIRLGLLILIATPIVRVIFCIVGFARQRDLLYVAISTTVLLILLYSLFRGGS